MNRVYWGYMIVTEEKKIDELLSRGVEEVYPDPGLLKKALLSGKKLRIYSGFDPTADSLHIGNAINIRKLAKFQELGHEIIFLIGDFTAMIGDPTDKSATRKQLTKQEVLENSKNYQKQVSHLISFRGKNPAKLKYNSKWLGKLKFQEVLELSSHFTVQRMLERDMFERRMDEGKPIYMHEFMYPLMQGYDSVTMDVDVEIGGNDQTFNMLAGRTLMKQMSGKEKFVITNKLLVDPTGAKMGKTTGNMINLTDSANEMFGKVMSWTDEMIVPGFEILTDLPLEGAKEEANINPRDAKIRLAHEVVRIYKSEEAADEAKDYFIQVISNKQQPDEVESVTVSAVNIVDVLLESGLTTSKSEGKRVIEQGGLKVDGEKVDTIEMNVASGEHLIQKGKRHFKKVVIK